MGEEQVPKSEYDKRVQERNIFIGLGSAGVGSFLKHQFHLHGAEEIPGYLISVSGVSYAVVSAVERFILSAGKADTKD